MEDDEITQTKTYLRVAVVHKYLLTAVSVLTLARAASLHTSIVHHNPTRTFCRMTEAIIEFVLTSLSTVIIIVLLFYLYSRSGLLTTEHLLELYGCVHPEDFKLTSASFITTLDYTITGYLAMVLSVMALTQYGRWFYTNVDFISACRCSNKMCERDMASEQKHTKLIGLTITDNDFVQFNSGDTLVQKDGLAGGVVDSTQSSNGIH